MTSFVGLGSPETSIPYEGKDYYLSPLTFKEMAEYVLWYQYSEIEKQEIVTRNLPSDVRSEILLRTHEECRKKVWKYKDEHGAEKEAPLSWETPEVQASCNTLEGIQQQLYLALKVKHPDMTKELTCKIVTLESYSKMLDKLLTAMGMVPELKDETKEIAKNSVSNRRTRKKKRAKSR